MGPRKTVGRIEDFMTMEVFIETLTGTAFELEVAPFDRISSVKAKIQKLEGLPVSQQHLIWQQQELEDDYCLRDYGIHDGATLKLVLAMRGGPINTRRIPLEDPALREMAEYMEANREEFMDKLQGNRQVTLLVFREGDQLNFFRVVERGDGTLSPLTESLSGASIYNEVEGEEEEEAPSEEKLQENARMREKLRLLKHQMEGLALNRKHQPLASLAMPAGASGGLPGPSTSGLLKMASPKPPGVLSSKASVVGGRGPSKARLKRLPSAVTSLAGGSVPSTPLATGPSLLNTRPALPPLGQSLPQHVATAPYSPGATGGGVEVSAAGGANSRPLQLSAVREDTPRATTATQTDPELISPAGSPGPSQYQLENVGCDVAVASSAAIPASPMFSGAGDGAPLPRVKTMKPPTSPRKLRGGGSTSSLGTTVELGDVLRELRPPVLVPRPPSSRRAELQSAASSTAARPPTSSKRSTVGTRGGARELTLESLSQDEARAMSGILRQASLERLGSSKLSSFVRSGSRAQMTFDPPEPGTKSPEVRRVSSRLRRAGSRAGDVMGSGQRLPPVKTKKKKFKRCYLCNKKTGLASSYQCRCGNNFCATHRYAEAHACDFDYKTEGRKILEQSNPVVSAPKLPKI